MLKRVLIGIVYLVSVFMLPWWVSVILGLALLFYFDNFFEIIFGGVIIDGLYGSVFSFHNFGFIFTIAALVLYFVIRHFKKDLRI